MFANVLMEFLPHVRDVFSPSAAAMDPISSMAFLGSAHDIAGVGAHLGLVGISDPLQFHVGLQGQQGASALTVRITPFLPSIYLGGMHQSTARNCCK